MPKLQSLGMQKNEHCICMYSLHIGCKVSTWPLKSVSGRFWVQTPALASPTQILCTASVATQTTPRHHLKKSTQVKPRCEADNN
jgi:hypothetical protein